MKQKWKMKIFEKLFVFDEKKSVELFGITYFNENPIWFIRKSAPKNLQKCEFSGFSDFRRGR